jgi:S-(hydroxymethyl)mycothiol dehydrogenase
VTSRYGAMVAAPGSLRGLAVVAPAAGSPLQVVPIHVASPGPFEVRVRLLASGICHTDTMVQSGAWWPDFPYVLGHEGVGVIEAVGRAVPTSRIGERVLLAWRVPCHRCRQCRRGRERLCVELPHAEGRLSTETGQGLTPSLRVGSHATYAVISADQAIGVAADLSPEALCLIGCAVMTGVGAVINTAAVRPGESVAVFGCGGVGLSVVQGARLAHARTIIAVDRNARKLELAQRLGATHTVVARGEDVVSTVRNIVGSFGVDHAFEAVGSPVVLQQALDSCDTGGICTILGTPQPGDELALALKDLYFPRLQVRVSQYGDGIPSRDFPSLVDMYRRGELMLDELVTQTVPIDEAPPAFVTDADPDSVRTVIRFGEAG